MGLERELWIATIMEELFKDNEFMNYALNDDDYVLAGKIVHLPQAGAASGVEKNRTTLPATIVRRADSDITYVLDEYTSNPILVTNLETIQYSYNKRESVLRQDMDNLKQAVAEWLLRSWAPSAGGSILRTTGAAVTGMAPSATGNRKGLTKEDLKKARLLMNKQNVPKSNRKALIPSDQMDFLLSDPDLLKRDSSMELDLKGGVVTRLYGFDLIERSSGLIYNNAGTPVAKDPGAAEAATDNQGTLCWHPNFVRRAKGAIDFFERIGDPTYYGDIFSMLIMMGGRIARADQKGIVSIVEAAAA
jgi:Phage capsid protein